MAAKKQDQMSICTSICDDIKQGHIAPVYLLHGEESYFIDKIADHLLQHVITEEEQDFNLTNFYGADLNNVGDVVSACRRYPMMAERQLVIFREMQAFDNRGQKLDDLSLYISHPLQSTVLVLIYKTKKLSGALPKLIKNVGGVVFESEAVPEYRLKDFVRPIIDDSGLTIDDRALDLLCNSVGADLSRMFHEIDKLRLNINGKKKITLEDVASNIGISKEFNNWELQSAIGAKDFLKVEMIRRYFAANPKANPLIVTLSTLFSFFTNLMLAHYCKDKSVNGLMAELKLSYPAARDMTVAMKNYNGWKTMENISLIREYDARCKGAREVSLSDAEALQELLYQLMH